MCMQLQTIDFTIKVGKGILNINHKRKYSMKTPNTYGYNRICIHKTIVSASDVAMIMQSGRRGRDNYKLNSKILQVVEVFCSYTMLLHIK